MSNLSPNFYPNRVNPHTGEKGIPLGICIHLTGSSFQSARGWLCNPQSEASANKLIGKNGQVLTLVRDEDAPWTNGYKKGDEPTNELCKKLVKEGKNINCHTLTIETEWTPAEGLVPIGSPLWNALVTQCVEWCEKYKIAPNRIHIFGHYEVSPKSKPLCGKHIDFIQLCSAVTKIINGKKQEAAERNKASDSAADAQAVLTELGITDGLDPKTLVTREYLWELVYKTMEYLNSNTLMAVSQLQGRNENEQKETS